MNKQSKTYNAGQLIKDILEIYGIEAIEEEIEEEEVNKILFSLGFPHEKTTLNIEWGIK